MFDFFKKKSDKSESENTENAENVENTPVNDCVYWTVYEIAIKIDNGDIIHKTYHNRHGCYYTINEVIFKMFENGVIDDKIAYPANRIREIGISAEEYKQNRVSTDDGRNWDWIGEPELIDE